MEILEARNRILNISIKCASQLSVEDIEALAMADLALKTIDEMDTMLSSLEKGDKHDKE